MRTRRSGLPPRLLVGTALLAMLAVAAVLLSERLSATQREMPLTDTEPNSRDQPIGRPATEFAVPDYSQTRRWLAEHPRDPRTPILAAALDRSAAVWLVGGDRDQPNLAELLTTARAGNTTALITLYNIPGRDDGITGPTDTIDAAGYRAWVDAIAAQIGDTPAMVVVEPDALWLADRQFTGDRAGFDERLALIRYAAQRLARNPATHIYLEAGTTSGSVSADRLARLLVAAGASARIGFAVNVSSFAPQPDITRYAQDIRARLIEAGIADPRYVVDTSRNGNPDWDNDTWCNPPDRKIGSAPTTNPDPAAPGQDANLWVKAPGTSDGACGIAPESTGGEFLPDVALGMVS